MQFAQRLSYLLGTVQNFDLIELLVVDVGALLCLPLAFKGWKVQNPSCWCRWNLTGFKRLLPGLLSTYHFSLEGANHQVEVVPQHSADDTAEDVDDADVWVDEDADEDVGDVENMADHSHDDPGYQEAGIPLTFKLMQACLGLFEHELRKVILQCIKTPFWCHG